MKYYGIRGWGPRRPRRQSRKPIAKPTAEVAIVISQKVRDEIKLLAFENNETMAAWIRDAIERKLKDEKS